LRIPGQRNFDDKRMAIDKTMLSGIKEHILDTMLEPEVLIQGELVPEDSVAILARDVGRLGMLADLTKHNINKVTQSHALNHQIKLINLKLENIK
jgi:hypothetical protein